MPAHEHPIFNSRYCHRCQINWPYDQMTTTCFICDAPTQAAKDGHEFKDIAAATVWGRAQKQTRVSQQLFEAYYKARLVRITDHAIAKFMTASDATIADWLLQLTESVNQHKEVADGGS